MFESSSVEAVYLLYKYLCGSSWFDIDQQKTHKVNFTHKQVCLAELADFSEGSKREPGFEILYNDKIRSQKVR